MERVVWTRARITARVDELHAACSREDFAAAVQRFSRDDLVEEERVVLRAVLLERVQQAAAAQPPQKVTRGWIRRMIERAEERARRQEARNEPDERRPPG